MVQKDPEVRVIFQYKCPHEEDLTTITYKKPKNVDSIIKCLVDEVSEELDKLRIEKNISTLLKVGWLKYKNVDVEQTETVDCITDTDELKEVLEPIIESFDADQELCIFIDDTPGALDKKKHYKCHRNRNYQRDSSSLSRRKAMLEYEEDRKFVRTNTKNLCNDEDIKEHYVGLVNQAMTCYLNSLLQALYMTPEFRNALYNWEYKSSERDENRIENRSIRDENRIENRSIPFELQKLFLNLQTSQKPSVETTSLTRSFGWDSSEAWQQHDIQELCRVMFDALERKFKNTEQADLINKLYEGKINDYVKCLNCNTVKSREDTFLDIPLPVRPFDANEAYGSVEEALAAFVKYETLEGNNQYFCEKCDKKTNAHKGLKFTKFPYILTLQLKRFDFDQNTYHRIKLNDKVTFPDVLNLNSFIESASNPESPPSPEEDAGLSVKCDDNCTTDSSTNDEECALSNATSSNSNHLINHDQLDDEGIVMSNGMSPSSCSSLNQNHVSEKSASMEGPYIYELFSIMIHSGSASGGHYYVYIKDFRTDKWLCFNDQNVTSISSEDIQKTYGGGNKSAYCTAAYRSSTNAYMLMYRQIDPERNRLPMKAEDFPPHIKNLVEKMKNEDNTMHTHQRNFRKAIYYRNPSNGSIKTVNVSVNMNDNFADIAAEARKRSGLEDLIEENQCRIVTYIEKYDLVGRVYDQNNTLDDVYDDESKLPSFLLDIRDKKTQFEPYHFDPIITKVYVIDALEKDLIDGPKYIRAFHKMNIEEYKRELLKHFPTLDFTKMILLCKKLLPERLLEGDVAFDRIDDDFIYIVSVCDSYSEDTIHNVTESVFFKMSEYLEDIVSFYIDISEITEENMENIPSYNEFYKEEKSHGGNFIINHYNYSVDKEVELNVHHTTDRILTEFKHEIMETKSNLNKNKWKPSLESGNDSLYKYKSSECTSKEEWNIQETSNSEDSSLSDSDRTLVGDIPEESSLDHNMIDFYPSLTRRKIEGELSRNYYTEGYEKDRSENEECEKYFKCVSQKGKKLLKIIMDQSTTREELKEKLEKHLDIPKNYFRISICPINELDSYMSSSKFKEDQTYSLTLGRVTYPDETEVKVYILKMECSEPLEKLCTTIVKKDWRISDLISKIAPKVREEISEDFPGQWQFLEYNDGEVGDIIEALDKYSHCDAICIMKLDKKTFTSEYETYIRKWDRSELELGDPEYISVSNKCNNELREKISEISKIPLENLELTTLIAQELIKCKKIENLEWQQNINLDAVSLQTYILYRDSSESPKSIDKDKRRRVAKSTISAYTPHSTTTTNQWRSRREKPLVIHLDTST